MRYRLALLRGESPPDPGHLLLPVVPRGVEPAGAQPVQPLHAEPRLLRHLPSSSPSTSPRCSRPASRPASRAGGARARPTDGRIPALLNAAGSFRWALYYEQEGSGNPTSAAIAADLAYIGSKYAKAPGYLRVGGKPVLFVYGDGTDGCGMADRWKAVDAAFYVVLKVFPGYTDLRQPAELVAPVQPRRRRGPPGRLLVRDQPRLLEGQRGQPTTGKGHDPMEDQRRGHDREPRAVAARRHLERVWRRLRGRGHDATLGRPIERSWGLLCPHCDLYPPRADASAATPRPPTPDAPPNPDAHPSGGLIRSSPPRVTSPAIRARTRGAGQCDQAATAQQIVNLNPTAVLTLGDNQYESEHRQPVRGRLQPDVGRVQGQDPPRDRQPRVPDDQRRGLLRLLRCRRGRPGQGLLQLRPRRVAPDQPQLRVLPRRRLRRGQPRRRRGSGPTSRPTRTPASSPTGTSPASPTASTATRPR
jgi:hypothetical protein